MSYEFKGEIINVNTFSYYKKYLELKKRFNE